MIRVIESEVSNHSRFTSAAEALFFKYCDYLKSQGRKENASEWTKFEEELITIQGKTYSGNRCNYESERIKSYKNCLSSWSDFNEKLCFDHTIDTKVRGLPDYHEGLQSNFTIFKDEFYWKDGINKEDTDWFSFQ